MRLRVLFLLALAVAVPAAAMADTSTPGFQLQADGLLFGPLGELPSQHSARMSDMFANGGGFAITATVGLTRRWAAGLRVASYRSTKDGQFEFLDFATPAGLSLPAGAGPYTIERELELLPIHALLQYRRPLAARLEWQAEGGAGLISTIDHMSLVSRDGSGTLASISGYQKDASWTVGTALALQAPGNLDVVASARYIGTFSGDGAVWMQSDDPSFTNWTLGLRYPHNTH